MNNITISAKTITCNDCKKEMDTTKAKYFICDCGTTRLVVLKNKVEYQNLKLPREQQINNFINI
jgi:Zn finger protein HypA/HybF involved in hydrogenase expression